MLKIKRLTVNCFIYTMRALFAIAGRDWREFYSWMLNRQDRKVKIQDILAKPRNTKKFKGLWDWWRGEYYWDYMKRHGVRANGLIVDIGCGYGRLAVPLLREQKEGGHFIGTEISEVRAKLAQDWINLESLAYKSYEIIVSKDIELKYIADCSADCVFAMSVFNHMPDRELSGLLAAISRILKSDGQLFAYYVVPEEGAANTLKTFRRTDVEMEKFLLKAGLDGTIANDWDNDLELRNTESRMTICRKI